MVAVVPRAGRCHTQAMSEWEALRDELREHALQRGWCALGVTGVEPFSEARERGLAAVAAGRMDGMPWMTAERITASTDLGRRYPWARSIIALAWPYAPVRPGKDHDADHPRGRMAAYAMLRDSSGEARDYHDLLASGCDELVGWLRGRYPATRAKRFVDHGWAMDRAVAERSGIGFTGKHASLLTSGAGSYVLLAEIALSLPLPPDAPSKKGCGSCTACLPSCPTGAIVAPGVIDARRCISYLTIEHSGPVPVELRPLMGTWVFGCDLCQEACPINHRLALDPLKEAAQPAVKGPVAAPDLVELLELDEAAFDERFAGTPVARTGRARLARNAAIALGNVGAPPPRPSRCAVPPIAIPIPRSERQPPGRSRGSSAPPWRSRRRSALSGTATSLRRPPPRWGRRRTRPRGAPGRAVAATRRAARPGPRARGPAAGGSAGP